MTAEAEGSKTAVRETIKSLKKMRTSGTEISASLEVMSAARDLKRLCEQPDSRRDLISEVKRSCPELVKKIPDFEKALDALVHIPLSRLSQPKEVLTFVDALIESGIASQSEQGLVFVLGNTGTGKTSLVNTFKDFVENPSEKPRSGRTKPGDSLIETQVLEVYDGLSLKTEKGFKAELTSTSSSPAFVTLKEFEQTMNKNSDNSRLQLKIVDLGNYCQLR